MSSDSYLRDVCKENVGIFPKSVICGTFCLLFLFKSEHQSIQCTAVYPVPSHLLKCLSSVLPQAIFFHTRHFHTRAHLQGRKEAGPGPAKVQRSAGLLSYRGGVFFHSCSSRNSKHHFPLQALPEIFMAVSNLKSWTFILLSLPCFTFTFQLPLSLFKRFKQEVLEASLNSLKLSRGKVHATITLSHCSNIARPV